jgi:outer membrane usher protein
MTDVRSFVVLLAARTVALPARFACAQEAGIAEFDPAFLPGTSAMTIDLSRYSRGNPVTPGTYVTEVWVNGEWRSRRTLRFAGQGGAVDAWPCLSADDLTDLGIDIPFSVTTGTECVPLADRLPQATTRFDVGEQRLDIEVPQATLSHRSRQAVAPDRWDEGVPSAQMAWHGNMHRASGRRRRMTSHYLSTETGANAGSWRLRLAGSYSPVGYRRRHLYVERPHAAWGAQWRAGEFAFADDTFQPQRVRGVALWTDPRMADDGSAGDMPIVRGVARTHSVVRITQGDIVLRELSVPPGPFLIDDLQGAGHGGDIQVSIEAGDGQHTVYRVPYFPMPERLREGRTTYAVAALQPAGAPGSAAFAHAVWRHGFAHGTTILAGTRVGSKASSFVVGAIWDTLLGAFAADVMHDGPRSRGRGRRARLRYGRRWRAGSTLSLGLLRAPEGERRLDAAVGHPLGGDRGDLSIRSAYTVSGRTSSATVDHALTWNRSWRRASVDVAWRASRSRARVPLGRRTDTSIQFGLSVPIGVSSAPTLTASMHSEATGGSGMQANLSGHAGRESEVGYALSAGRTSQGVTGAGVAMTRLYQGGEAGVAVHREGATQRTALTTSGAIVVHASGITRAQRLGDTMALVRAPGATGARVSPGSGTRVDSRGFAVVPFLAPYRWNAIDIDPSGLSLDVAMVSTRRRVVPTAGALVPVTFETDVARTVLLVATRQDGSPIPFAAHVEDEAGRSVGVVGQAGRVFVRRVDPASPLIVRWGGEHAGTCTLRRVGGEDVAAGLVRQTGVCE